MCPISRLNSVRLMSAAAALWSCLAAAAGSGSAASRCADAFKSRPNLLCVEATSSWQFAEHDARTDAKRRLHRVLLDNIMERTPSPADAALLPAAVPSLLFLPAATRDERIDKALKPYGTMYRCHVTVRVPDESVRQWALAAVERSRVRVRTQAAGVGATLLAWCCGLAAFRRLDLWTRGYRRPTLAFGTLTVLIAGTVLAWIILLN